MGFEPTGPLRVHALSRRADSAALALLRAGIVQSRCIDPALGGRFLFCYHDSVDAGRVLREARRRAGLSQRDVAKRADVPQSSIAKIESGVVIPRVDTLDRLLAVCGEALEAVRRKGEGVDRSVIRNLIRISPSERASIAVAEARNVDRLLAKAKRR